MLQQLITIKMAKLKTQENDRDLDREKSTIRVNDSFGTFCLQNLCPRQDFTMFLSHKL